MGSQSIIRALNLLKSLELGEASLDELATRIKLNKSTTHRIMKALISEGLVDQDPATHKYYLSYEVLKLSVAAKQQICFHRQANPVLYRLAEQTNETVHLSILAGDQVICIDKVESSQPVRVFTEIGTAGPLYCTGSGKCLMAFLPEKEVDRLLRRIEFKAYTRNTITNPDDLRRELTKIRDSGVAYDLEEHQEGVMCVAAPVYNYAGDVIAAISLALPSMRTAKEDLSGYAPLVLKAAKELSTVSLLRINRNGI